MALLQKENKEGTKKLKAVKRNDFVVFCDIIQTANPVLLSWGPSIN